MLLVALASPSARQLAWLLASCVRGLTLGTRKVRVPTFLFLRRISRIMVVSLFPSCSAYISGWRSPTSNLKCFLSSLFTHVLDIPIGTSFQTYSTGPIFFTGFHPFASLNPAARRCLVVKWFECQLLIQGTRIRIIPRAWNFNFVNSSRMRQFKIAHHCAPPIIAEVLARILKDYNWVSQATNTSVARRAIQLYAHMEKGHSCISISRYWLLTKGE